MKEFNYKNLSKAKSMRSKMTEQEKKLWLFCLKQMPVHFYRQRPIGNYVADFYCAKKKIVIEVDGSQHYLDKTLEKDNERTAYFNSLGIVVIRYTNLQIDREFDSVKQDIWLKIVGEY